MLIKVQEIYKSAIKCNDCFANNKYGIQRGLVSKAQPRWIGKNYFSSNKKVVMVAINPGNVGKKSSYNKIKAAEDFQDKIMKFWRDNSKWDELMSFINEDMENWGNGRYKKFYFDLMKLKIDEVALMNMMLCSATPVGGTRNAYSKQTLENCYNRFTRKIIIELNPEFIILSGTLVNNAMKKFKDELLKDLPNTQIINTFHYRPQNPNDWARADEDAIQVSKLLFN
tara:strand:+ start:223 stop:900 length:678 start_codon:yes stop_codon:yes gene_type:complete